MYDLLKYFPHERIVKDEFYDEYEVEKSSVESSHQELEYRDEANRPWWKYFDEFEYRKNPTKRLKKNFFNLYEDSSSGKEKALVLKLDILIAFYAFMGYWCKFLDNSNLTNAYVTGMKEDLGMKGNDLIDTQVIYTVGSVIFTLPFTYILPRFTPTYVLFVGEFIWSFFTLITFLCPNVKALKAFRFIIGAAETSFFPVIHHLLTVWYKPDEVSRRGGCFYIGQYLGILTAGLLQSSIFEKLNGVNGLPGWKWVFIIEGLVSFAICFLGFFMIPGTPYKCCSLWLNDDEIRLARKRMRQNGSDVGESLQTFFDKKTWVCLLKSWHFWIFAIGNIGGFNATNSSSGSFALWLNSLGRYDKVKLNNLTTIPPGLGIIWVLFTTFLADFTKKRFLMICVAQLMNLIGNVILAIWNVPEKAKWFAYYFSYWAWAQSPVFYPLQNDILRHAANLRAIEWVICYVIGLQSSAWISKIVWPTEEAPRFLKGFITSGAMGVLQAVTMIVGYYFYKKDERIRAAANGIILYNSAKGDLPGEMNLQKRQSQSDSIHDSTRKINTKINVTIVISTKSEI